MVPLEKSHHRMFGLVVSVVVLGTWAVENQDCSSCGSLNTDWQDDKCKRFVEVTASSSEFVGRFGHATTVFPSPSGELALWLVGGRGSEYSKWNFESTTQFADVYYSVDGAQWTQVRDLRGDFEARTDVGFLMEDVMDPGDIAPFWERYGHSVDVVRARNGTGGVLNVMVLAGGYTPRPDNDVWISEDGLGWHRVGYAPWAGRGHHATAVFRDRLLVMGGSPLNNEVWAGEFNKTGPATYAMRWEELGNATGLFRINDDMTLAAAREAEASWALDDAEYRWSPRAGAAASGQFYRDNSSTPSERLFLAGGFGGWPCDEPGIRCHPLYDGMRARNDVWVTRNGGDWSRLVAAAPWAARAWHSLVTWADLVDPYRDVALAARGEAPRLWLAGGGFVGERRNNVVRHVDAYADLWWSRDGRVWTQVSTATGTGQYLCTSMESYKIAEADAYAGKYGHTLEVFWRTVANAAVCEDEVPDHGTRCSSGIVVGDVKVPALFFVAGDAGYAETRDIEPSSSVFASRTPVLCDIDGHKCPYPQELAAPYSGSPPSYRRRLQSAHAARTRAGVCPDPLTTCDDALYCDQDVLTFYLAENNSAELPTNSPRDSHQFSYTVYNASKLDPSDHSIAGFFKDAAGRSLLAGYVARLQGCQCSRRRKKGSVQGVYSGEYCEVYTQLDSARAALRPLLALLAATSSTLLLLL